MRNNYSAEEPSAHICINNSRCRFYKQGPDNKNERGLYDQFYYLNANQEFQIELYNPTSVVKGVKIKINGNLSTNTLVLRPSERVFLDRNLDDKSKFLFTEYLIDASESKSPSVKNNGVVEILFYDVDDTVNNYPFVVKPTIVEPWISPWKHPFIYDYYTSPNSPCTISTLGCNSFTSQAILDSLKNTTTTNSNCGYTTLTTNVKDNSVDESIPMDLYKQIRDFVSKLESDGKCCTEFHTNDGITHFINLMREKYRNEKSRISMIESFLTIFNRSQEKNTPFDLFPKQKEFLIALKNHKNNVLVKSRSIGASSVTAAFLACEIACANQNSPEKILIIGSNLLSAQQMITKIKEFVLQIPRWFWGNEYYSTDPDDDKNKKDIFVTRTKSELKLFNGCRVVAKSSDENNSRGISDVSWLIFDEAAFIEKGPDVYLNVLRKTSINTHIIMISTPNGRDGLHYEIYKDAIKNKDSRYHATEMKWYHDPRYNKFLKWEKKAWIYDTNDVPIEIYDVIKDELVCTSGAIRYNPKKWNELIMDGYKPQSPSYNQMCTMLNNNEDQIGQELDGIFLGLTVNDIRETSPIFFQHNGKDMIYVGGDYGASNTSTTTPPISTTNANFTSMNIDNSVTTVLTRELKPSYSSLYNNQHYVTTNGTNLDYLNTTTITTASTCNNKCSEKKVKTGFISKGEDSKQEFGTTYEKFKYSPSKIIEILIQPNGSADTQIFSKNLNRTYCTNCGKHLKPTYKFCPKCGQKS